jgi:hypothetical protein
VGVKSRLIAVVDAGNICCFFGLFFFFPRQQPNALMAVLNGSRGKKWE